MNYLMGIDLGSTSLKAVIYDLQGNKVAASSRPTLKYNPSSEHPEWTVWQPEQIWGGTADSIREALAMIGDPSQIKAVAVTGMGLDGVPIDEFGHWLYPFISWHDNRTLPQFEWWKTNIGDPKTFLTGGWPLWATSTALRILWMKENEPEIMARTDKWLLIEDFLNFMLCGRKATDYTMASCTAVFDQARKTWSDELLDRAGIERHLFSDVFPSGTILGEVTAAASKTTGLAVGTPVVLGGHDFLCGALPVGAFKPGVVLDVTGTWEVVLACAPKLELNQRLFQAGLALEAHVARNTFAGWGGAVAGEMLEWFRREYGYEAHQKSQAAGSVDWDWLMENAAKASAGCHGTMFLPHLSGAASPVIDPKSMGAFVGLTNATTQGEMLRAIIEGLDYQFMDIVSELEAGLNIQSTEIIVVGGATRNKFWMQNKADVTGRSIIVSDIEDASPLGAAILAGIGVGLYRDEQDAFDQVQKPGTIYEPHPKNILKYADGFQIYRQLYATLKQVNHQLYEKFRA